MTSNDPNDQQSALTNLDQVPYTSGTGKSVTLPLTIPLTNPQTATCTSAAAITGQSSCPNNAANFGSVTGTIGGSRAFTMGFHIMF